MLTFQRCSDVPVKGGSGGLVEISGDVYWKGWGHGDVYMLKDDNWKNVADGGDVDFGATLGRCGEELAAVGGWMDGGTWSKKVKVWRGGKWSPLPDMLVGCAYSCPLAIDGGGMVVMGGRGDGWRSLRDVQVFDGKTQTWRKGSPLPRPCTYMSAVVLGDQIFAMGALGMGKEVWSANISDLTAAHSQYSVWMRLPDAPRYLSSICVVDGVLVAIGGAEGDDLASKKTSNIYAFNTQDKKWQHVTDMPFEGDLLYTVLVSGGRLLVVDGYNSQRVLRVTVEELFPSPLKFTAEKNKKLYEEAMAKGYVVTSVTKCLILGAAGVGKTHLKHLLLNKEPPQLRVSTGLADNPVRAISFTLAGVSKGQEEDDWFVVEDQQAMMSVIGRTIKSGSIAMAPSSMAELVSTLPKMDINPSNVAASDGPDVGPTPASVKTIKEIEQSKAAKLEEEIIQCINQSSGKEKLFGVKWIQFIDSGGQLQYHDILPLFIQDPMVTVFVVKLSDQLSDCPSIEYYGADGKPVRKAYRSSLTHQQIFEHCLGAMRSQNAHPLIIIVGTHRDVAGECLESIKEKNQQLEKLLHTTGQVLYNGETLKEVIFAVNSKAPQVEDRCIAKVLRQEIVGVSPQSVKMPVAWFGLEVVLQGSSHEGILTLVECQESATRLHIEGDAFLAALHHLVQHNVFLHYPKVLPQTVFTDPQVVLTKVTEVVQHHHKLLNDPDNRIAVRGDLVKMFRDHGVLSVDLLKKFPKHYQEGLFSPQDLLKLLVNRGAIAKIGEGEYLMPALLPHLDPTHMSKYCEEGTSLMIRFSHGYIPSGLFCCVAANLLSSAWKVCMNEDQPLCLYRNCITLIQRGTPVIMTIADMSSYIQVNVCEASSAVCKQIRSSMYSSIKSACSDLNYQDVQLDDAFLCTGAPCMSHPPHVAIVTSIGPVYKWRCTIIENQIGDLGKKQLLWLFDDEDDGGSADDFSPVSVNPLGEDDLLDVMEEVVDTAPIWRQVGTALRLRAAELDTISSKNHNDPVQCLRDMLLAWLHQRFDTKRFGEPCWRMLCQAVHKSVGGNNPALAKKIAQRHS